MHLTNHVNQMIKASDEAREIMKYSDEVKNGIRSNALSFSKEAQASSRCLRKYIQITLT